jgi:hypothetical protein
MKGLLIIILMCICFEWVGIAIDKQKIKNYNRATAACTECKTETAYYVGQRYVDTEEQVFADLFLKQQDSCQKFVDTYDSIGWWGVPDTAWWVNPPFFKKSKW